MDEANDAKIDSANDEANHAKIDMANDTRRKRRGNRCILYRYYV